MYERKTNTKGKQFEAIINKSRRNKMKAEDAHSKLSLMIFVLQYSSVTILTSEGRSDVHFFDLDSLTTVRQTGELRLCLFIYLFFLIWFFLSYVKDPKNTCRRQIYIMSLLIARFSFLAGYKVIRVHKMLTVCSFMSNLIYIICF